MSDRSTLCSSSAQFSLGDRLFCFEMENLVELLCTVSECRFVSQAGLASASRGKTARLSVPTHGIFSYCFGIDFDLVLWLLIKLVCRAMCPCVCEEKHKMIIIITESWFSETLLQKDSCSCVCCDDIFSCPLTSNTPSVCLPRRRLISQRSSLETLEDIEENAPLRRYETQKCCLHCPSLQYSV